MLAAGRPNRSVTDETETANTGRSTTPAAGTIFEDQISGGLGHRPGRIRSNPKHLACWGARARTVITEGHPGGDRMAVFDGLEREWTSHLVSR
jgi:hypothetical protein